MVKHSAGFNIGGSIILMLLKMLKICGLVNVHLRLVIFVTLGDVKVNKVWCKMIFILWNV